MAAQVTVKLYASLMDYLPPGAKQNRVQVPLNHRTTIGETLDALNVPREQCHLVLLNGHFVPPASRASHTIADGDTIAVWPPVAGG